MVPRMSGSDADKAKGGSESGSDFLSEQRIKKLRKWVEAQAEVPPGYEAYVDHLLLEKADPEVVQSESLRSNKKLTFRYLLEKTHPAQNKFAPLSYGKLLKAFTFTVRVVVVHAIIRAKNNPSTDGPWSIWQTFAGGS